MYKCSTVGRAVACGALIVLVSGAQVSAAENISADIGLSYKCHFVSYGVDVWGAGNDFFGDNSTTWLWGDLAIKATDALTFTLTVWSDNNDNVTSGIGGHIQEIDFDPGFTYTFGKVTAGATYNAWSYAGDGEESVDLSLGFDDTGLIMPGFALGPQIVWADRGSGNGWRKSGSRLRLTAGA